MKYLTFRLHRAGALPCVLASACLLISVPLAAQAAVNLGQRSEVWMAASNKTLDSMRGGFDLGAGLLVSFGITRSVSINGNLIVTTSFNIPNLSTITPAQAALVNQQVGRFNLVQNGPGNTVQPSSTTVAASSVSPGPLTVNTVAPGGGTSGSATTVGTATVTSAPINGASLGTFIQNTLNNQQIQSQTVINASTNSLGAYKVMNMYNGLNGALTNSLGTR
ncbi:MAG TPA: hypothetical protein VN617_10080 [Rhodoferax sp.]|nr:hypothetical protein [Rhodoferax sp.]